MVVGMAAAKEHAARVVVRAAARAVVVWVAARVAAARAVTPRVEVARVEAREAAAFSSPTVLTFPTTQPKPHANTARLGSNEDGRPSRRNAAEL